jgi:hypothetical protein
MPFAPRLGQFHLAMTLAETVTVGIAIVADALVAGRAFLVFRPCTIIWGQGAAAGIAR